jgi:uracil-DNA glycosylase
MPETNLNKAINQHLQMDNFFTGGLTAKGQKKTKTPPAASAPAGENKISDKSQIVKKIESQINKCDKCILAKTRTNTVPGQGNLNARIVFVGEGPGADEDAQGIPFVGRAGQLLDKIIAAMTLNRSDVYICNTVKCRPPQNRDPKPEEIQSCLPFLQQQLELINPEIIVALGAHAAKTLLQTEEAIGQLRGQFHEYYTSKGAKPIKLMPTYHPSYLLRNYSDDNRRRVWEDMQKVMAELGIEIKKS